MINLLTCLTWLVLGGPKMAHDPKLQIIDQAWEPRFESYFHDQMHVNRSDVDKAMERAEGKGASKATVFQSILLVNAWRIKNACGDDTRRRLRKCWETFPATNNYETLKASLLVRDMDWGTIDQHQQSSILLASNPNDKQLQFSTVYLRMSSTVAQLDETYAELRALRSEFPNIWILRSWSAMCCAFESGVHKSESKRLCAEGLALIDQAVATAPRTADLAACTRIRAMLVKVRKGGSL